MKTGHISRLLAAVAFAGALAAPGAAQARGNDLELAFDRTLGTQVRTPPEAPAVPLVQPRRPVSVAQFVAPAVTSYGSGLEAQIASLAAPAQGRIGVAALDLSTGRTVSVLGNQPFPLASTSKVAIAATFLAGVDQGRFRLSDQYPLMVPVRSAKYSTEVAPVRAGATMSAQGLIELAITRSDNPAADALLAAVGGPQAVNRWLQSAGLSGMRMDRDIATLVRDDGEFNPATTIDPRDSATPLTMVELLGGLYRGQWLSSSSRNLLLGTMARTVTGKRRMRALLPGEAGIAHKTGTLSNTASDVGIITTPDGRSIAVAIYVTGQGSKAGRDARIASIARAIYDGYQYESSGYRRTASR